MLEKNLQKIGLNNREVKIYIELLKTGTQKASYITKKVELPKTTVTDTLNSLYKKGLISKFKKKNAYYFTAYDPDRIIDVLEKKRKNLQKQKADILKVLPMIKNLQNIDSFKPQIEYLEGNQGLIDAFEDTLKVKNKNILCYGSVDSQAAALPDIFPEYFQNRVKRKISATCLIPAVKPSLAECLLNDQKHLRKSYFIPEDMVLPLEINIYEDNTNIVNFEKKFAVIIRSKIVTDCLKIIFKLAFEGAKKYDKEIRNNVDMEEIKKFWKKWKKIRKTV